MPCAFVAALVLIYALWPEPKVALAPPLPSPNGYDDFVKAGTLLAFTAADYRRMPKEDLEAYVSTNQEPLRLVRLGLTRECQVPMDVSWEQVRTNWEGRSGVSRLTLLIAAEGRLAELEKRFSDAARAHLDNVRFGQRSATGGRIIDKFKGVAFETIGMMGLERIVDRLDTAEVVRECITTLETADARSTPASDYINRDRQWYRKATRSSDKIRAMWVNKTLFPDRAADQALITKLHIADRRRRQLLLNLAARAYELERGKKPVRAEDLVPSVLRTLPKDPETGTNLVLNPVP